MAAKGKYNKKLLSALFEYASEEWRTDKELYTYLHIHKDTFYTWKKEKPDFSDTLKRAEEVLHEKTRQAARKGLLSRIEGYDYEETHQEGVRAKDGTLNVTKVKKVKKHYAPDVTAIIFALKNLDSDNFADKHLIGGDKDNPVLVQQITGMKVQ